MDTGPKVQGRLLDIYMWSCHEALAFGRKPVQVTVLRLGWNPNASSPSLIDRLFRRREAARKTAPPPEPPTAPNGSNGVDDAISATESAIGAKESANVEPSDPTPSDAPLAPSSPFAPVAPTTAP